MDFIYLFRVLLKRKWIILGAGILAGAIAYLLTMNQDKQFRSTARISTGYAVSDEISNDNFSLFEADNRFNNAIVTFKSPSVISLLSYELVLHDLNSPAPFRVLDESDKKGKVYRAVNVEEAKRIFQDRLDNMTMLSSYRPEEKKLLEFIQLFGYDYKTLLENLNIDRLERTDYIQIDYVSENPELSAFVVNSIYKQFMRYYRGVRNSKSSETIDSLQKIVARRKEVLDQKNGMLQQMGLVSVEVENQGALTSVTTMEDRLAEERAKYNQVTYDLQKVNQRIAQLGRSAGPSSNAEVLTLRRSMNEAYAAYLNSNDDKALLARYNQLKDEYNRRAALSDNEVSSTPRETATDLRVKKQELEIDQKASYANIAYLQGEINRLRGKVSSTASQGAVLQTLEEEVKLATKEYQDAKQAYNDATDITASSVNNFRQALQGQPAIEPEPSMRGLIVGMAGAAAMITSILILVVLTFMDSSVKTPAIFSKTVNLRLIAMVNYMNLKNRNMSDIISNRETSVDAYENKRHNVFRESLRKLRYEIENSGKKIFLFTSTKKGQGKTTLIQALSYSLSMSKKKILIIDTNFCNNDLTIQLDAEPILEKISTSKNATRPLLDQVRTLSKNVGTGSIFAIGSEGGDYTPSEVLPRENLLHHLKDLTGEFDYIFLEGPPLNDFSDSKELSQYVDGVIGVFSAQDMIRQIDMESIAFFRELNGKYVGSILNMVDLQNVNVA